MLPPEFRCCTRYAKVNSGGKRDKFAPPRPQTFGALPALLAEAQELFAIAHDSDQIA